MHYFVDNICLLWDNYYSHNAHSKYSEYTKGGLIMELILIGIVGLIMGRKPKAKLTEDKPLRVVGCNTFVKKDGTIIYFPVYGR